MFDNFKYLLSYVAENDIQMLDFKIVDLIGRWRHLTVPASSLSEDMFQTGFGFDGSNYGYTKVENSDMIFIPEIQTAFRDPFWEKATLSFTGSIYEITPEGKKPCDQDPRAILRKAIQFLTDAGLADTYIIGPEFEFYVFDNIKFSSASNKTMVSIESKQADWINGQDDFGNGGYLVSHKSGYHAGSPNDSNRNLRSGISLALQDAGVKVKYHHHEVGGSGQQEIELTMGEAQLLADHSMLVKYFIKNMAFLEKKTATFMPKPIYGEAGNGFHVHIQLLKEGHTVFADDNGYMGLSREALYFIGGILKHSPALMGLVAPSTNSYKRLVSGYEAPVAICFGSGNRSAVVRIPAYAREREKRRFEFRAPDATCNPYLAYAAILMAGLDGIKKEIDPVAHGYGPVEQNIYDLTDRNIELLPSNLESALSELEQDMDFLLVNNVFQPRFISNWIKLKKAETNIIKSYPHPKEYEFYYDI